MIKSMDTAVSAIKAQQTRLDVTANNIANVNTVGFKKSRTMFTGMLNQAIRTASAPSNGLGGINPSTIGFGVQVASIDTIHTQGILAQTGRALDLAINNGDGFFTVTDGTNRYYTRSGAINLSPIDGSLALSNGMKLMGYPIDESTGLPDKSAGLSPLNIPTGQDAISQATENVQLAGNISSALATGETVKVPFSAYDSLGTKHDFEVTIEKDAKTGEAKWTATSASGMVLAGANGKLKFDTDGKLVSSTGGPITANPIGAKPLSIAVDFSKTTMMDKTSDFSMKHQDGMPAGSVTGVTIANGGMVRVTYSNGMSKDIAALGIATFDNPSGLQASHDNLFTATSNSGEPVVLYGGENNRSNVAAGYLESSNVDVSEELTDMIKTQRAYQMATKVVTTSDEILQELMTIKR